VLFLLIIAYIIYRRNVMDVKCYSFNLNHKKHKHLIDWIEKEKEKNDINLSSLIRRLLEEEYKRKKCLKG